MNYCPVRLGKGHLQPFVLWSLILKASPTLTLQGRPRRQEAFLDAREHWHFSTQHQSHVPHRPLPHSQQCHPHSLSSTSRRDTMEGRGAKITVTHRAALSVMQIDCHFPSLSHFCHVTLWSFSTWKKDAKDWTPGLGHWFLDSCYLLSSSSIYMTHGMEA